MIKVGIVFEHPDYLFSGKDHEVVLLVEPRRKDEITFDFLENELNEDLGKDLQLANVDTFKVIRRNLLAAKTPRLMIFLAPVSFKKSSFLSSLRLFLIKWKLWPVSKKRVHFVEI